MQLSYENYETNRPRRNGQDGYQGDGPQVKFLGTLLKADGDSIVVRFPYHSMADIKMETCHSVTFPGDRYPKKVRCTGEACPLCAAGVKLETRFFVKVLAYIPNNQGSIDIVPAVWDRPAAFADIEIKNLMQDYGDLTISLFKIKRNGTGLDTRYTMSIIMANNAIYNPEVYKPDFALLDSVDASKILAKTMDKYLEATGNAPAPAAPVAEEPVQPAPAPSVAQVGNNFGYSQPAQQAEVTYTRQPYSAQSNPQPSAENRPSRYNVTRF